MSTNWKKYCRNLQEVRNLSALQSPKNYGLVSFMVKGIRINPDLDKLTKTKSIIRKLKKEKKKEN